MKKARKYLWAFGLVALSVAMNMPASNASQNATITNNYSCPNGGVVNGTNCDVPGVGTSLVPAQQDNGCGWISSYHGNGVSWEGWRSGNNCFLMSSTGSQYGDLQFSYYCPEGTLSGSNCLIPNQATTYVATNSPTYTCPNDLTVVGTTCVSAQDGANALVLSPFQMVKDFVVSHLLPVIVGLVAIGIAIKLGISAVRRRSKM